MKKSIAVFLVISFIYLMYITNERFGGGSYYSSRISSKSIIQDPFVYGLFDYLSQWYYNSMYLLDSYNFSTFKGQISLKPILDLMGQYYLIDYNPNNSLNIRMALWPDNWYTFNGLVAYFVYDYGYLITIALSLLYFNLIMIVRPYKNEISLNSLFVLVLLIQIPLMAIFYSMVQSIVLPSIFLIPIFLYLRVGYSGFIKDSLKVYKKK
ncbi:MAG: hypothetical protein J0665_20030 [Deltaproteobacteria bacterium]|nr:hypothetical protein [Deltaproteobacteria bacterium]